MRREISTDPYFDQSPMDVLEEKIEIYNSYPSIENYIIMSKSFMEWLRLDGNIIVPVNLSSNNPFDRNRFADAEYVEAVAVPSEQGDPWLIGYTNLDEAEKILVSDRLITTSLKSLYGCLQWSNQTVQAKGIVINPWGCYMILTGDILRTIFN